MHVDEVVAMRTLAAARRWLNGRGMKRFAMTDAERERRVAEYARQVAEHGRITAWLPPPGPDGVKTPPMPVMHPHWR